MDRCRYAAALEAKGSGGFDVCLVSGSGMAASVADRSDALALFIGINLPMWERIMKDSIGTIARRTVLGAMFLGTVWLYWKYPAKPDKMICDIYALLWIASLSAVGYGNLVDAV